MSEASPKQLRETAELLAREAGAILRDRFDAPRTIELKGGIDLVTDADTASEERILELLTARHPDHEILSEESGLHAAASGPAAAPRGKIRWIIDPLDGTTNYSHQVPHFAVSIAAEGPKGLLAGVVYDPMQDELFSAALGEGTTLNGSPARTSEATGFEHALLSTGFPYDVRENPDHPLGLFGQMLVRAQGVRRMGSAALDLAYVAAGRFDGFFELGLHPWDIAAGALLVREAGGVALRIDGEPLDLGLGDILAVAPGFADTFRTACAGFLREVGYVPKARARRPAPTA